MAAEKPVGHDWDITYRFDGEETEVMLVFGRMTIEDAVVEARLSLDGIVNMNVGTYEIISAVRRQ